MLICQIIPNSFIKNYNYNPIVIREGFNNQYNGYIESPGIYNYMFDGSLLPSGIYIYQLQTDSGINLTNKMMLIK